MSDQSTDPTAVPSPAPQRFRVIIADDSPVTRRSTRLMVSLIPTLEVVGIAQTGREAVELARKHNADIALMDVQMPEMDGLNATQAMLRHNPEMVCVILSAESDSDTLRRAITAGAKDYLIKPYTSEQFVAMIKPIVEQLRVRRSRVQQRTQLREERDTYLVELATSYIKARRTDDTALQVFERLAADPHCETRWLRHLAIIYVLREQWGKLRHLAERLEQR